MRRYLVIFTTLFFVGCSTSDENHNIQIKNEPILEIKKQRESLEVEQQMEQIAYGIIEDSVNQSSAIVDGVLDLTNLNSTML
ncbi:hypothetical protein AN640_00400 [Candidatus Epulonipiscium fishelsonii]|uniref:Uncharacterized protein n=1 Tax=Candidatus Epulonipiscium fishelsonii TaxID=77094 RepID=A0ACC8XBJ7_9FIRM|nr:hypothetical protein AN640_00400 [Epulopiscium sp. SCG-D08WGA-EpuloA1]OON95004.1 MAG: hypothetical protein ATN32_07575 [Epulopiscium sp. AS2M-Bin002]